MGKTKRAGFTLIELMLIMAIIGIIAAVALPKFSDLIRKSRESRTKGNLSSLRWALSIYYSDMNGIYPQDALSSLTQNGKYISQMPACDPDVGYPPSTDVVTASEGETITLTFGGASTSLWVPVITNTGKWAYDNNVNDNYYGRIWVDTTLPDSRGNSWLLY